ncbi:equilibrative nucleoside transporter 1-like isoform X2 [Artemia franciscana]|uniref:equilibrative nucleoside transporter 1-like isoform X2 n=1 Tax=Artemia franciscana TaxID=6661 RepID=UPI0032DBA9D3
MCFSRYRLLRLVSSIFQKEKVAEVQSKETNGTLKPDGTILEMKQFIDDERPGNILDGEPPTDKWNIIYTILIIHGVGTLMPWNMFITAKDYFVNYKLEGSDYASNFLPILGFMSQVPNMLLNWTNVFVSCGGNLTIRVISSILVMVLVFIATVILAMVNSSEWQYEFYVTTMALVVILNMAGGIYQNTVYGMAAKLPSRYTGAVVLGSNVSGTITAIVNIVTIAVAPNVRTSAIYYFITALFILLVCFVTFFALPLNNFYSYNEALIERQQKQLQNSTGTKPRTPYWTIFKKCLPQCFNVFFVFFVTLSIFPSVHSDIKQADPNFFIEGRYYTAVTCFLTFNVTAMLGNMIPSLGQWPGPKFLVIPVLLRLLFIPFFLFCNYQPLGVTRTLPVFFENDWVYWTGAVLLGLSSGYYSSLAMMYCPRTVDPDQAATAGMFAAASLITGIFVGVNFSIVMPKIVSV